MLKEINIEDYSMIYQRTRKGAYEMKDKRVSPVSDDCEVTEIRLSRDFTSNNNNNNVMNNDNNQFRRSSRIEHRLDNDRRPSFFSYLNSSFESTALEIIYQNYFSKRRRKSLSFLLLCLILYNLFLLTISILNYDKRKESYKLVRICTSSVIATLSLSTFVLFVCKCIKPDNSRFLSGFLWIIIYLELIIDLLLASRPLLPTDLVGVYMFFIYVTYSMIAFRLYACIIISLITTVSHAIVVCVSVESMSDAVVPQVRIRSSHPDVFCKKGVLRKFAKFTGNICAGVSFLIKLQDSRPATLLK